MPRKKIHKLTKEWLYQRYYVEGLSANEIAKEAGVVKSTVFSYMKKFNVTTRPPLRQDLNPERECTTCKQTKDLQSSYGVYKSTYGKTMWRRTCMECRRQQEKERYETNPDVRVRVKHAAKVSRLKNTYGLTLTDVDNMYIEQKGACAICCEPFPRGKLNIDHCHSTGKVRGLLCWPCNVALGHFKDSRLNLSRAESYLQMSGPGAFCEWLVEFLRDTNSIENGLSGAQNLTVKLRLAQVTCALERLSNE